MVTSLLRVSVLSLASALRAPQRWVAAATAAAASGESAAAAVVMEAMVVAAVAIAKHR